MKSRGFPPNAAKINEDAPTGAVGGEGGLPPSFVRSGKPRRLYTPSTNHYGPDREAREACGPL